MQRRTALWLSHHYPDDYDRCATVAGRHVCRRCLWFYPACFAVTVASLAGLHWPASLDVWMLWLLPVPVVAEWWGEHLGRLEYRPGRSVLLSLLAAPAVGRGLGRYLLDQSDPLFWSVVAAYAVICAIPMVLLSRPRQHSRGPRGRPAADGGARPAP